MGRGGGAGRGTAGEVRCVLCEKRRSSAAAAGNNEMSSKSEMVRKVGG